MLRSLLSLPLSSLLPLPGWGYFSFFFLLSRREWGILSLWMPDTIKYHISGIGSSRSSSTACKFLSLSTNIQSACVNWHHIYLKRRVGGHPYQTVSKWKWTFNLSKDDWRGKEKCVNLPCHIQPPLPLHLGPPSHLERVLTRLRVKRCINWNGNRLWRYFIVENINKNNKTHRWRRRPQDWDWRRAGGRDKQEKHVKYTVRKTSEG